MVGGTEIENARVYVADNTDQALFYSELFDSVVVGAVFVSKDLAKRLLTEAGLLVETVTERKVQTVDSSILDKFPDTETLRRCLGRCVEILFFATVALGIVGILFVAFFENEIRFAVNAYHGKA